MTKISRTLLKCAKIFIKEKTDGWTFLICFYYHLFPQYLKTIRFLLMCVQTCFLGAFRRFFVFRYKKPYLYPKNAIQTNLKSVISCSLFLLGTHFLAIFLQKSVICLVYPFIQVWTFNNYNLHFSHYVTSSQRNAVR
jgi:hypothetical protein